MTARQSVPQAFFLEDVVRLKKPHPCGSHDWTVVRLGADIGLRCHGCDRRVLLPRRELERRIKSFLQRGPGYAAAQELMQQHEGDQPANDNPPEVNDGA